MRNEHMNHQPGKPRLLPDFCTAPAIAEILIIAELVAMVLTMARGLMPGAEVLQDFIAISLFMLWLALASAAVLCAAGRWLAHLPARQAYLICYGLLLITTVIVSAGGIWLDRTAGLNNLGPGRELAFIVRNLSISAIVSAVALRYFHVQYQWQHQVQRETGARIEALQARMRPHFLFNSMNTIAALIPVAPEQAEQAVEDLADLFRASLAEASTLVSLDDELTLARLYQRLEQKRMGERLKVEWRIVQPEGEVRLPRLTLQPLLENAIHHGIERLPEGGTITVTAAPGPRVYRIAITNPVPPGAGDSRGFRIALNNTRERLSLALGDKAALATERHADYFEAVISLPMEATNARPDR